MLHTIDLNLFVLFEVIYDTGSLTQTAQTLNKTQPAISNALARLRRSVGDPLFIHAGKKMNPTARADDLIGPVRQALRLLQDSLSDETGFNPALVRKTVRLSVGDIGETIILPGFLKILRQEAPGISVHVVQIPRRSIARKLAVSEIDLAIDILMSVGGELRQCPLMSDRQVCVLSFDHPLASEKELTLEAYLANGHIHVSSRSKGDGVADIGLGKFGASRTKIVRLQHHQAAFAMLDQSGLLLAAPSKLAELYPCKVFELPFEAPGLDLHLYWHNSTEGSALGRWLREKMIEAAGAIA